MKKKGSKPPKKLHVKKLKEQSVKDQLVTAINENLQTLSTGTSEEQWRSLKNAVYSATSDVLGKPTRKHKDWFDESNEEIMELVNAKSVNGGLYTGANSSLTPFVHSSRFPLF